MKSVTNYFEELKIKFGSDYKVAQMLKIDRAAVNWIKKKEKMGEETAVKVAELLEEPEEKLLIAAAIARNSGKAKEAWERVARILGYLVLVFGCFTLAREIPRANTSHNA